MKILTRMELKPGMILGADVVEQGKVLYTAGQLVDERMIERFHRYSVLCVTIMEDVDFATTHYERIRFDENFKAFEQEYDTLLLYYKSLMKELILSGNSPSGSVLIGIYKNLYSYIPSGAVLLDYLYNMMPNEDELTYSHSLNSALLAGAIADWLSMSDEDKNTLILCGFYYDIGKLKLPYDLLWKPSSLTDEEYKIIKTHPVIGYAIVRNMAISEHVKNSVIMHHERLDGSGYPYHMSGSKIDIFARYSAIIDAYIAMASPRAYRPAFTPLQILGNFENSIDKFDAELLMPIMRRIADAQVGSKVQLNDGSVWEVLIIHPNKFSRPILRNSNNEIIDLLEEPEFEIVKMV